MAVFTLSHSNTQNAMQWNDIQRVAGIVVFAPCTVRYLYVYCWPQSREINTVVYFRTRGATINGNVEKKYRQEWQQPKWQNHKPPIMIWRWIPDLFFSLSQQTTTLSEKTMWFWWIRKNAKRYDCLWQRNECSEFDVGVAKLAHIRCRDCCRVPYDGFDDSASAYNLCFILGSRPCHPSNDIDIDVVFLFYAVWYDSFIEWAL